jgi:hypothetical protein
MEVVMPPTAPLKTAVFLLRLNPDEKAAWEAKCAERRISLAEAMREGARLYLDELRSDAPTSSPGDRVAAT